MFKKKRKAFEMTPEEGKSALIQHFWRQLNYWDTVAVNPGDVKPNESVCRYRLEGLLHSILATLDGNAGMMPGFELKALVPTEDQEFHKKSGTKYFPKEDIGGSMAELMYPIGRENKLTK